MWLNSPVREQKHYKMTKVLNIYIFISFLLYGSSLYSQRASRIIEKIYSENQQFHVQIKGYQYEGFVGDQQISLINSKYDTLLQQIVPRRFLIHPSVSNEGDVAITHREIKIYDKNNELKGILKLSGLGSPYSSGDGMGSVQGFSITGDKYFIALVNNSGVNLFCLSDSANYLWNVSLGKYRPCGLLFYKDKVVIHDSCNGPENYCYIFDLNGNILWQYQPHKKSIFQLNVTLDKHNGILILKDKIVETQVKLDQL